MFSLLVVLVAGTAAGCGSSGSSSSASTSTPAASAPQSSKTAAAAASPTAQEAVITTKHQGKLGTILAYGPKQLTVYLFEADKAPSSNCSAACASAWPPVIGSPTATGAAHASTLSTIRRSDGSLQVTYNGHPLYRFIKDKDDGDAYGQGVKAFGAEWYVLAPSGNKIDES